MSDEYEQHRGEDASYENEQSTVTITLKEYDKLKGRQSYYGQESYIRY